LPPNYSDLSGPPFCYGFVNQQRNLFTRHANRPETPPEAVVRTRGLEPGNSGFITFYDGVPMYFPPTDTYPPMEPSINQPQRRQSIFGQPPQSNPRRSPVFKMISWSIVIVLWILVPMASLMIGTTFVDSCPVEQNIPSFLIIAGCVLMLRGIIYLASSKNNESSCGNSIGVFLDIFTIFWVVLGSYWVFSVIGRVDFTYSMRGTNPNYCHRVVFSFALWLLVAFYILFLLAWLFVLICICVYIFDTKPRSVVLRNNQQRRQSASSNRTRRNRSRPAAVIEVAPRSTRSTSNRRSSRRSSTRASRPSNPTSVQPSQGRARLNRMFFGSDNNRRSTTTQV